jgi:parvulin-like peptidyl-prolyl isomerase
MRTPRPAVVPLLAALLAALPFAPARGQDALAGLIEEQQEAVADDAVLLEGIAAQVGSEIVLVSEVRELAAPAVARAKQAGASERDLRMIEAQALERLIEKALLRIVVKRAELQATDEEIDGTIAEIASDNGITPEQLKASVEAQGLPYAAYRERIRGEIEHSKVIQGVIGSRIEIDPKEVEEAYRGEYAGRPTSGEEFRARSFVIAPPSPKEKAEACERVRAARARVAAGEDLLEVASGAATMDPELGWVHESQLAPWLEAAVRPGERGAVRLRVRAAARAPQGPARGPRGRAARHHQSPLPAAARGRVHEVHRRDPRAHLHRAQGHRREHRGVRAGGCRAAGQLSARRRPPSCARSNELA